MSGYTKLFSSILASTVWNEPVATRVVWITLLAMSDRHGIVEGSIPGLAVIARLPTNDAREAITRLSAPDPDSRSQEAEGRRIEAIDGGWRLVNYAKYRAMMSADERRDYVKMKAREYRQRRQTSTNVDSRRQISTMLTHTDPTPTPTPETEAEKREKAPAAPAPSLRRPARRTQNNEDTLAVRAGELLRRFEELYHIHRHGARLRGRPALDWTDACDLVRIWDDDARLEKLAVIVLTTDDEWIASTDRGFKIFAMKASWADDRLKSWEFEKQKQKQKQKQLEEQRT